jgi:ribosomal protein S21
MSGHDPSLRSGDDLHIPGWPLRSAWNLGKNLVRPDIDGELGVKQHARLRAAFMLGDGCSFRRHRVSRTRRILMGVRITVGEGESIELTLKRFRKLLERHRASWKWYKPVGWRGLNYYVKPSKIRGVKRFVRKVKARAAAQGAKLTGEH